MYINFQQIRVSKSVHTVHINIFANNRKLHNFATTNSNIEKKNYFRYASSYNVHVINFQQIWVSRSVKTVLINIFTNNRKLLKFATTNSNFFYKLIIPDMHHRITYMYINFQQNCVSRLVKTVH